MIFGKALQPPRCVTLWGKAFDPDQPRDEHGRFAESGAAGEMASQHPFPGELPQEPPGLGRPDLVAQDPKLQAALAARTAHTTAHHRAFVAHTVDRMLNEPAPKPVPIPSEPRLQVTRAKQAIVRAGEAVEDLNTLTDDWLAQFRADVAGSHPKGRAALRAAYQEAVRRRTASVNTAREHVAALPAEQRSKAEKLLSRALGETVSGKSLRPPVVRSLWQQGKACVGCEEPTNDDAERLEAIADILLALFGEAAVDIWLPSGEIRGKAYRSKSGHDVSDQSRDEQGRFGEGGGGSKESEKPKRTGSAAQNFMADVRDLDKNAPTEPAQKEYETLTERAYGHAAEVREAWSKKAGDLIAGSKKELTDAEREHGKEAIAAYEKRVHELFGELSDGADSVAESFDDMMHARLKGDEETADEAEGRFQEARSELEATVKGFPKEHLDAYDDLRSEASAAAAAQQEDVEDEEEEEDGKALGRRRLERRTWRAVGWPVRWNGKSYEPCRDDLGRFSECGAGGFTPKERAERSTGRKAKAVEQINKARAGKMNADEMGALGDHLLTMTTAELKDVAAKAGLKLEKGKFAEAKAELVARMGQRIVRRGDAEAELKARRDADREKYRTQGQAKEGEKKHPAVDKLDLTGMNNVEKDAVRDAIDKALTVGTVRLKIPSIRMGQTDKEGAYAAHYSGSAGEVVIDPSTIEYARSHNREETLKRLREAGGTRNYAKEEGSTSAEVLALEAAHELGHHVENAMLLDLQKADRDTIDAGYDLSEDAVSRMSGYGSVNLQERFAETHALMSTGREHLVPESVQVWYRNALATADPEPLAKFVRAEPDLAAKQGAAADKPGFTGTDALGREWRNGELVAKR